MPVEGPATGQGDLRRTPLAHLLVYAVEHRLSGMMLLTEPGGIEHVIRFERGVPVKVRMGDGYAMFGELLVEDGLLSRRTLEEALATKGLLGDVLLLAGCVDAATLDWIAEVQFVKRMVHLFELPPGTTYRYFEGHAALADWGGEPARVDPLTVLWAGLRDHGAHSTRLQGTLDRLGNAPLRLHPTFDSSRFGFRRAELAALDRVREDAPSLAALIATGVAPEAVIRRLVYALLITRFIEVGVESSPVGVEEGASRAVSPPSSQTLARMQLRSISYRVGAAAPDLAGDGERGPVSPRNRRRKGAGEEGGDPAAPGSGEGGASTKGPPSGGRPPPSGGRPPPSGGRPPPSGDRPPPSGGWQPPSGGRPPPSGGRPPPSGDRQPPSGGRPPPREQSSEVRSIGEDREGIPSSSLRLAGATPAQPPAPEELRAPSSKR